MYRVVVARLFEGGFHYKAGDEIELTEDRAKQLGAQVEKITELVTDRSMKPEGVRKRGGRRLRNNQPG